MWARTVRTARPSLCSRSHRTVRFSRSSYNGQQTGPQTSYFQPPAPRPPPRSTGRTVLLAFGSTAFGIAIGYGFAYFRLPESPTPGSLTDGFDAQQVDPMGPGEEDGSVIPALLHQEHQVTVPPMDLRLSDTALYLNATFNTNGAVHSHGCQLPSNPVCEDVSGMGAFVAAEDVDPTRDWPFFAIYDGHAGPATAHYLASLLPVFVGDELAHADYANLPYAQNDYRIWRAIKAGFRNVDDQFLRSADMGLDTGVRDLAIAVSSVAGAISGSCALISIYDPAHSILRVANTGDSRAVLGRWDETEGRYIAQALSTDHTGFNPEEVARLRREHPGEDPVDPQTGRVFGLAVTRAFGDARWKWAEEKTRLVHEKFFGPTPRPGGVIKTPPYLTAEPEITETKIQGGKHPDFVVMASDGLWDIMSNADACLCVQKWLEKYHPNDASDPANIKDLQTPRQDLKGISLEEALSYKPDFTFDPKEEEDTYWCEKDKTLKWRIKPEHFVVEDVHCGVHLIKNALGGKRRNLFRGLMTLQPPYSRNVRDDITVQVLFFEPGKEVGGVEHSLQDKQ